MRHICKWMLMIAVASGVSPVWAATTFCVTDDAELAGALFTAEFSPLTIKIVPLEGSPWHNYDTTSRVADGTSLLGGYMEGCAGRDIAAGNTVLKDDTASTGDSTFCLGDLTIEGITFRLKHGLYLNTESDFFSLKPASSSIIRRSVLESTTAGLNALSLGWDQDDDLGGTIRNEASLQ